jgi:hypothetical protein
MAIRFYGLSTRSKIGIIALGTVAVVVVVVLVVVGLALLLGLSALGVVLAIGASVYRKLTGRSLFRRRGTARQRMDAALEVFPHGDETVLPGHRMQKAERSQLLPDTQDDRPTDP